MGNSLPTVKIVNPDNPGEALIMNAADYDPKRHTLWADREPVAARQGSPLSGEDGVPSAPSSPPSPYRSRRRKGARDG